jgi:hypothetical protein
MYRTVPPPRTAPPVPPQKVRIITSNDYPSGEDGYLEPNICNTTSAAAVCIHYARVEMQVGGRRARQTGTYVPWRQGPCHRTYFVKSQRA